MSSIQIVDLNPAGSNLFLDSESYLNELTQEELSLSGGGTPAYAVTALVVATVVGSAYAWGRWGPGSSC